MAEGKYPVTRWIAKHGPGNIAINLIETCESEALDDREIHWIAYYRSIQEGLLNVSEGGRNYPHRTPTRPEVRDRIASALRDYYRENPNPFEGRKHSEESRNKMSLSATGRKLSDEAKRKVAEASRGRPVKPETLKLLSEMNSGENNPMYGRVGYWRGKKRDEGTVEKMRFAHQGEKSRTAILKEADVRHIRTLQGVERPDSVAANYGVSSSAVRDIWAGRTWKHLD